MLLRAGLVTLVGWLTLLAQTAPSHAQAPLAPGSVLNYRGTVEIRDRDASATADKQFDLTIIVREIGSAGAQFDWIVDEQGPGGWPWIERFGKLSLNKERKPIGSGGPSLLCKHPLGESVVSLVPPLFAAPEALAMDATWTEGELEYEVKSRAKQGDYDTWQVEVRNSYGPKRNVSVEPINSLVVANTERVFMGQGTEYQLQMRLTGRSELSNEELTITESASTALAALREQLKRPVRSQSDEWNAAQREVLTKALPELGKQVTAGPFARIVKSALLDIDAQSAKAGALDGLTKRLQGATLPKFELRTLDGSQLGNDQLLDKTTVLHFWEYRDEPLKEPYGQIGYLEFLYGRHKKAGVAVYGVAVDSRLKGKNLEKTVIAGVRKLRTFMNLTYPIALDDGELISKLGDPRTAGANLPMFLVVDRTGKIVHVHIGHYAVDQQRGLKELDEVLNGLK